MDIAFQLVKPPVVTVSGNLRLKGMWINQAFEKSYVISTTKINLLIKVKDQDNWYICNNPELNCIRYATWRKLK